MASLLTKKTTALTGTTCIAAGNGYVDITLVGLDTLTQSYTVTATSAIKLNTLTGGTGLADTATITLAGSPASGASGDSTIQATISNTGVDGTSPNYAVVVNVKFDGKDWTKTITGNTAVGLGTVTLNKNYDLADATITVTQVPKLAVDTDVDVKVEGTTYTITFNRDIALKAGVEANTLVDTDDATAGQAVNTVEVVNGNQLKVVMAQALASGKKLNVNGVSAIVDAAYAGNAMADDTALHTGA